MISGAPSELICADSIISYDDLRDYFSTENEIYVLKKEFLFILSIQ